MEVWKLFFQYYWLEERCTTAHDTSLVVLLPLPCVCHRYLAMAFFDIAPGKVDAFLTLQESDCKYVSE